MALLNELSVSFAIIIEYAINTGFRLENILYLTVEQIRFHDVGNIGNTDTVKMKVKGGMWDSYPIGPNAVDVLNRAIGDRKTGYVFINKRTGTRY